MGSLGCLQIVLRMQSVLVSQADALANKATPRRMFGLICHRKKQQLSLRAELWALGPALNLSKGRSRSGCQIRPSAAEASGLILDSNKRTDRPLPFLSASSKSFFSHFFFHIASTASCPAKLPGFPVQADCRFSLLRGKLPVHPSGPGQAEAPQDLPSSELLSEIWSLSNGCEKTQKLVLGSCITFISEHFVAGK